VDLYKVKPDARELQIVEEVIELFVGDAIKAVPLGPHPPSVVIDVLLEDRPGAP
jgi:hypothetical protein